MKRTRHGQAPMTARQRMKEYREQAAWYDALAGIAGAPQKAAYYRAIAVDFARRANALQYELDRIKAARKDAR